MFKIYWERLPISLLSLPLYSILLVLLRPPELGLELYFARSFTESPAFARIFNQVDGMNACTERENRRGTLKRYVQRSVR